MSTAGLSGVLAAELDFLAGRFDRWAVRSDEVTAAVSARALAASGRDAAAASALGEVDVDHADPGDLAAAAWAASRVGGTIVGALLERLTGIVDPFLVGADVLARDGDGEDTVGTRNVEGAGAGICVGPTRMFVGMLRAAQGDLVAAASDLTAAVGVGDARAPIWGALARLELSRVLGTAAAVPLDEVAPVSPTVTAARVFFAAGGYSSLLERVVQVQRPVTATLLLGRPCSIGFGVHPPVPVRPSKGLVALHHLVANSDRVVTAAELAVVLDGGDVDDIAALMPEAWHRLSAASTSSDIEGAADDVSAAVRKVFFDDSRRSRISKLLRRTIDKLGEACPPAGAHLQASVRTGHGCRYLPAGAPVQWQLVDESVRQTGGSARP